MYARFNIPIPKTDIKERLVWNFSHAGWEGVRSNIEAVDWATLVCTADAGAENITCEILRASNLFIPSKILKERKSTHPWVNERIVQLVQRKKQAAGTTHAEAQAASEACSVGIKAEYAKYVAKEKERLQKEARGSKGWW